MGVWVRRKCSLFCAWRCVKEARCWVYQERKTGIIVVALIPFRAAFNKCSRCIAFALKPLSLPRSPASPALSLCSSAALLFTTCLRRQRVLFSSLSRFSLLIGRLHASHAVDCTFLFQFERTTKKKANVRWKPATFFRRLVN